MFYLYRFRSRNLINFNADGIQNGCFGLMDLLDLLLLTEALFQLRTFCVPRIINVFGFDLFQILYYILAYEMFFELGKGQRLTKLIQNTAW